MCLTLFAIFLETLLSKKQQRNITEFIKIEYFVVKLGDQDKSWIPHTIYVIKSFASGHEEKKGFPF